VDHSALFTLSVFICFGLNVGPQSMRFLAFCRHVRGISGLLLVFGFADARALAQTSSSSIDDTQLWTSAQFAFPVRDKIDLVVLGSFRIGRDISHLVYENGGAAVSFKRGEHLAVAASYLFVATQYYPGVHTTENRFSISGTVSVPWKHIVLSDVQVLEERLRERATNRYRNRLQIEWPLRSGDSEYRLFIANEVFYDWSVDAWSRNRLFLGGGKRFSKHWAIDLFFVKQNARFSLPRDVNAVAMTIRAKLDRPLLHLP
jgi:hypothetical protein